MKKTKTNAQADALLSAGTLTIDADSREELYNKSAEIAEAIPNDVAWTRGAVMHADGLFTQTFTIIK